MKRKAACKVNMAAGPNTDECLLPPWLQPLKSAFSRVTREHGRWNVKSQHRGRAKVHAAADPLQVPELCVTRAECNTANDRSTRLRFFIIVCLSLHLSIIVCEPVSKTASSLHVNKHPGKQMAQFRARKPLDLRSHARISANPEPEKQELSSRRIEGAVRCAVDWLEIFAIS